MGDTWTVKGIDSELGPNVTITNRVLSISETISTPAGTFSNCVKVRQTNTYNAESKLYYFIHPLTGIVKIEGMSYESNADDEVEFFPVTFTLKHKNF
ncbi:hypothetical protein D3C80_1023370 [compost metagenome]